jgi:hypothetical protein
MHDEMRYPVCPHRNVPAAFQRFLGPDSGGMERFFPEEQARRTQRNLMHGLKAAASEVSQAVGDFNTAVVAVWQAGAALAWVLAWKLGGDAMAVLRRGAALMSSRPVRLPA